MTVIKNIYRKVREIWYRIKAFMKGKVTHAHFYVRNKEKREYKRFLNSFKDHYSSDYVIGPDSECIYRQTYFNDRNKELVKMCIDNNIEGINKWYGEADADKMYYDEYYENRMSMRLIAKHISQTVSKDAFILDVACGHGSIDKELTRRGFKVKGIDLNSNRINELKPFVYDAECVDVDHVVGEENFDVLISLEMLEHVPNVVKTLGNMWKLLIEGGILYISVPNEYLMDDEQHVRSFSKASMIKLLQTIGFQVLSVIPLAYLNQESANDLVCVCKKEVSVNGKKSHTHN